MMEDRRSRQLQRPPINGENRTSNDVRWMYLDVLLRGGVPVGGYGLQLHGVPHQQLDQRGDLHLRHLAPAGDGLLDARHLEQKGR